MAGTKGAAWWLNLRNGSRTGSAAVRWSVSFAARWPSTGERTGTAQISTGVSKIADVTFPWNDSWFTQDNAVYRHESRALAKPEWSGPEPILRLLAHSIYSPVPRITTAVSQVESGSFFRAKT